MRWSKYILISALILLLAACGSGTGDYEEAKRTVLEEIVKVDALDHEIIVFSMDEPLQRGDVIGAYQREGFTPTPEPRTIEADTWFFWIDEAPGARFAHPSRFVFVDVESGEIEVREEYWWPVLNGEGMWVEDAEYWDESNWVYPDESSASAQSDQMVGKSNLFRIPGPRTQEKSRGRAIIINGWRPGETGEKYFATDAEQMVELMQLEGLQTTYYGPKNEKIDQTNPRAHAGELDIGTLGEWFLSMSDQLQPGDSLMVYITSHGWLTEDGVGYAGFISEHDLETFLSWLNPLVNVNVVIDTCHSGAFTKSLEHVSDVTITSTNAEGVAYNDTENREGDGVKDPNPDDIGGEFTSGFIEDWKEILKKEQERERAQERADRLGTSLFTEKGVLSFASALAKDVNYLNLRTFPQLVRGSAVTRPVVNIDPIGDGITCTNGLPLQTETPSYADISATSATYDPFAKNYTVTMEIPGLDTSAGTLYGGIEFYDPAHPASLPDPTWTFEGLGNVNFNFQAVDGQIDTGMALYDDTNGWLSVPEFTNEFILDGTNVSIEIPEAYISTEWNYYLYTAFDTACDAAALGNEGQPAGSLPSLVIEDPVIHTLMEGDTASDSEPVGTVIPLDSLQVEVDSLGDVVIVSTGELVDDPQVDIERVLIEKDPFDPDSPLSLQLLTVSPTPVEMEDYSFAAIVYLMWDENPQRVYIWEQHAGVYTIGGLDPVTGEQLHSDAEIVLKERVNNGISVGSVEIDIPHHEIPIFNEIGFQLFRTPTESSEKRYDELLVLVQAHLINTAD